MASEAVHTAYNDKYKDGHNLFVYGKKLWCPQIVNLIREKNIFFFLSGYYMPILTFCDNLSWKQKEAPESKIIIILNWGGEDVCWCNKMWY